jgi:formamidopyrimidine-DNA glycosylase
MPEMPEVETLARKLQGSIPGKRIVRVTLSGYSLRRPIAENFPAMLRGRTILEVLRRGKYLIIALKPDAYWLIHLGMSGRVLIHPGPEAGTKHTHVRIRFSDSSELEYRDPRRFGLMAVYENLRLEQIPELHGLGKDPLSAGFEGRWLESQLRTRRQEIKAFLLNQGIISGLGNIYACEALFLARIHPQRRCCSLVSGEANRLAGAIQRVLTQSIERRGTSFSDFVDPEGTPGENQNYLKVFQREGKPCRRCGALIRRVIQGNRSSYYCPACQDRSILQKG